MVHSSKHQKVENNKEWRSGILAPIRDIETRYSVLVMSTLTTVLILSWLSHVFHHEHCVWGPGEIERALLWDHSNLGVLHCHQVVKVSRTTVSNKGSTYCTVHFYCTYIKNANQVLKAQSAMLYSMCLFTHTAHLIAHRDPLGLHSPGTNRTGNKKGNNLLKNLSKKKSYK